MGNKEYLQLVEIAKKMEGSYSAQANNWDGSPFEWIIPLPSRRKGTVGEKLVWALLEKQGFVVQKSRGTDSDMLVNNYKVEIKMSSLWNNGIYKFQQIRDQDYEILICLGISPEEAHVWVTLKSEIDWKNLKHQHGGERGNDTWWISVTPPQSSHSWMLPQDGNLQKAVEHLRTLTAKPVVK